MRRSAGHIAIALIVAWSFVPGASEVIEQVVHVVSTGHFAHTIADDADEAPAGDEHGCQGLMHVCRCGHGAGQVGPSRPEYGISGWTRAPLLASIPDRHDDPPSPGVFHPPRA